jgi:hypothetical protein
MVVGMSAIFWSRGALESLYQGATLAFLSESQTLTRIFARVSVTVLNASSGEEAGIISLSSNRVSDISRLLDLGGVSARDVSLVLGGTAVVFFKGVGKEVIGSVLGEEAGGKTVWSFFTLVGGVIIAEGLLLLVAASCKEGVVSAEGLAVLISASYGGGVSCAGEWGGALLAVIRGGEHGGEVSGCL